MRVSLIKTTKIIDIILPHNHTGNYWITDFDDNGHEKNLICIEGNKKTGLLLVMMNTDMLKIIYLNKA